MKQLLLLGSIALFSFITHPANATVHYTQVGHKVDIGESYSLDIDNNGDNDYSMSITLFSDGDIRAYFGAYNTKDSLLSLLSPMPGVSYCNPKSFSFGSGFGSNVWKSCYTTIATRYSGGEWNGVTNKYAMIKFKVGTDILYGWINMTVASDGGYIIVNSFSYNDAPNTMMTPGEGEVASSIIEAATTADYYSYHNNLVSFSDNAAVKKIAVYDMSGRLVHQEASEAIQQLYLNQPSGMYVLEMDSKLYGLVHKRIFVQ